MTLQQSYSLPLEYQLARNKYRFEKVSKYKDLAQMTLPYFEFRGNIKRLQSSNTPAIILTGPTRTGKTLGVLYKIWAALLKYENARGLLIRKQRSDLSETALVTLERDIIGVNNIILQNGPQRDYRRHYDLPNGSTLVVGGLDKPGKILSSEYDIIGVPQAEELMPADWETLITRVTGTELPPAEQQLIGDCNPASPLHWIMQRSLTKNLELWKTFHKDNPRMYNLELGQWTEFGRTYLDRLSDSLTGNERKRLLDGEWVQAEGVVYSEFDTENITEAEPDPELPIELACDDGYVDPRAILFIQRTPTQVLVFDEIYHSRHLAQTCVEEVVAKCEQLGLPRPEIAIGPPEAKELQQRFRLADIPYRFRAHKILEGIPVVRRLVKDHNGARPLQVHKRCTNFIGELTDGYRYPEQGTKRDDEKPIDGNDHACDAFRYWAFVRVPR